METLVTPDLIKLALLCPQFVEIVMIHMCQYYETKTEKT